MERIKLVIVDDHQIIREGLIAILKDVPYIEIVGDVNSGAALMVLLEHKEVNMILLDMHMPVKGGIEVAREVKALYPIMKILINTMSEQIEEMEGAMSAGVSGYVLKTSGSDEVIKAIEIVAHENTYFGSNVMNCFIKNAGQVISANSKTLTSTELKIIKMLYAEKTLVEISSTLDMNSNTLKIHFQNMYSKLNIRTEIGLVKYALREKLIRTETI